MDEALRRLERAGEPLAYASALRRAGEEVAARRLLERATREGVPGAREALDAAWPLDARTRRLIERAVEAGSGLFRLSQTLAWLAGDEDPRLEPDLSRLAAVLEPAPRETYGAWALCEVARLDAAERRRQVLAQAGGDLPLVALARARLDEREAGALLLRAGLAEGRRGLLLCALWHVGRAGSLAGEGALRSWAGAPDVVVAAEARQALARLGAVVDAAPVAGLTPVPARPGWVPDACPAEARDSLTACVSRRAVFGVDDPWGPWHDDPPPGAAGWPSWVLFVDLDHAKRMNDTLGFRVGDRVIVGVAAALRAVAGDRVVRWGGDEWLVLLEPDLDGPALAERLRAAVAATSAPDEDGAPARVTVSIGVARAARWPDAVRPADDALLAAKAAGRDRVVVAGW